MFILIQNNISLSTRGSHVITGWYSPTPGEQMYTQFFCHSMDEENLEGRKVSGGTERKGSHGDAGAWGVRRKQEDCRHLGGFQQTQKSQPGKFPWISWTIYNLLGIFLEKVFILLCELGFWFELADKHIPLQTHTRWASHIRKLFKFALPTLYRG